MSGGFSDLVKVYIENLNLPKETKVKLLASNPKTLADVSMWLEENNKEIKTDEKPAFNPFSTQSKTNLAKEIQLFSNNAAIISQTSNFLFNKDSLVDTDDASWGLGIERTSNTSEAKGVTLYTNASTNSTTAHKSQPVPEPTQEQKTKEAQDNAIASIRENVNTSIEIIMKQMEEQGIISEVYNSLKEYFDAQLSLSSVCRTIFAEQTTADLLQKAQDGNLTKEEYWGAKIDTLIDMLTADRNLSDEERACLEERFAQYTPEELNQLIDKAKCTNQEDYAKLTGQIDKLIEEGRNLLSANLGDSGGEVINENPNSIKALMKTGAGKEIMTFNEVWLAERGVEFDPQAIEEYEQAAAEYAMVTMVTNKANSIHELLKDSMTLVKGNNENAVDPQTREAGEKRLETNLITALKSLYGDNEEKINQKLQEISDGAISYKDGQFVYTVNKGYCLLNSAQKLLDAVDENVQKIQGCYAPEYYKNTMSSAYELAYGRKNATHLAQAFANDQEEIVGKVRTGVELTGAAVMVGGMFFCPPAALAGALTASFGGIGVEALNEATRSEGLTDEAKKKITEELMTNAALFAVGGAAGKMGSAAKAALLAEKCPTLMACIADIGVDATISLLGDMALTGEIDIAGEGLSQLMSVLAGHVRKIKFSNGNNNISHFGKDNDTSGISPKQHQQNLKELKTKYKDNLVVWNFIKKHKDDRELMNFINNSELTRIDLCYLGNLKDEQIINLKELMKIERKEPLSASDMLNFIINSNAESFAKLKERGLLGDIEGRSKAFSDNDLISLLTISDEQWEIIDKRNLLKDIDGRTVPLSGEDIAGLSEISDEQWKIVEKRNLLKDIQGSSLDSIAIKALIELSDEEFQITLDRKLIEISKTFCIGDSFNGRVLLPLLNLSDEDWKRAEELLAYRNKTPMLPDELLSIVNLDDKDYKRVIEVLDEIKDNSWDFTPDILIECTKISDEVFEKLKNSGKLKDLKGIEVSLITGFQKFIDKKSIRDMSKSEKREFMANLMAYKNVFINKDINLKDLIGILPSNEDEYAQIMKKISQSLNISTKAVTAEDKAKIENDLKQLAEVLKNTDLSDLEEINLTMPHSEFIAKAEEFMKELSDEEKAKVMEYFGFKIQDGKLTGYPNGDGKDLSLADISDPKTIDVVNKMKGLVDNYTDNNFITVKDHPELNAVLKEISRLVPEIFNQIDGSKIPVETIKALQKIVQKPNFDNLSDSDKKVIITATLLHNTDMASGSTSESAFDAYFIGEKMGLNKQELTKLYKIVEASDLIKKFMNTTKNIDTESGLSSKTEREKVFNYLAFMLKDSNNFELAQMLYSTKEVDGLTRNLDKMLQNKIKEIKAYDFMLPQTSGAELEAHAKIKNLKDYDVKVVNSADISDFYVYIHALGGATTGGSEITNIANFDKFGLVGDSSVICASYVGNGKAGTIGQAQYGLIFDVDANNQHVGAGYDIWSVSKTVNQMLDEYFNTPNDVKTEQRQFIATELKKILNITDEEYIQRLDNIKDKLNGEPVTFEKINEIDPEFAKAYKEFFKRNSSQNALLTNTHHNEILVTNPKIKGIFTKDINALPEDLIKYAHENNIPIVIIG